MLRTPYISGFIGLNLIFKPSRPNGFMARGFLETRGPEFEPDSRDVILELLDLVDKFCIFHTTLIILRPAKILFRSKMFNSVLISSS